MDTVDRETLEQSSPQPPVEQTASDAPEAARLESGSSDAASGTAAERKKIEEQLQALERKQAELRRALAIADHPALADAIRSLEGRVYAVTRVESKIAEGLSRSEEKKRDALARKLEAARAKRAEIDAQIASLEADLAPLGQERDRAFAAERRDAMERLLAALATHDDAFRAAGLEASSLVPELARLLPEVQALAESLVAARDEGPAARRDRLPD